MTEPLTDQQFHECETAINAYRQHQHIGFACCSAHPVADAAPVLVAAPAEESHVVADDSDDPEHIDGCPGREPAEMDTLPAWLAQRFDPRGPAWDALGDDDRTYWEHHARAVRRAVARGGFKAPAVVEGGAR